MKKLLFSTAIIMLCCSTLYGQFLERQVIGSSGSFRTAGVGSLSFTTGEAMTNTFTGTTLNLTQGFQQPSQHGLAVQDISVVPPSIEVYPNPAEDKINIVVNSSLSKQYTVELFDMLGQKLITPHETTNGYGKCFSFIFDIHKLAAASYLIVVNDESGKMIKTFKFAKTN